MDGYIVGGTAALITAVLWSCNSILFSAAGKRIGALNVNAIRIVIAVVLLGVTHVIFFGTIVPAANNEQWLWMGVSGIVGLGIGDLALFSALVMIGPRRSLLLMSLAPVCAAIFGFLVLNEVLGLWAIIGIIITLSGITVVVLEREEKVEQNAMDKKRKNLGIILGAVGGIGQGLGLGFSKYGMINAADNPAVPLDSLSATLIRMIVGAIFVWICLIAARRLWSMKKAFSDRRAMKLTSTGAFIGPFLGVWFSMIAVTYIHVGIAQTIMALMPVIVIPMVWILYREKTSWLGIVGAIVAVLGVGILFLI
jgi:drug/metabolite transporter (DMT)-like permease